MYPFLDKEIETTQSGPVCIAQIGEAELIQQIRAWLGLAALDSPEGIGDDCAVHHPSPGQSQVLTVDSVTWKRHFDESVSPFDVGSKLVKRNLSDIAAMGARPKIALLNILSAPNLSVNWLEGFVAGIRQTCMDYDVKVVGGDLSSLPSGVFSASMSLLGETDVAPKLRSTAAIDDHLYVTGSLGGSILKKHYDFDVRLEEGHWLARNSACTAMMDITDGLAKDLPDLLPAGSSAWVDTREIPISEDAATCAQASGGSLLHHAFCDGEDYELAFTVGAHTDLPAFEAAWNRQFPDLRITKIGHIGAEGAARICDQLTGNPIAVSNGYEHFTGK